jgi:GTPase SAR1 family protein
MNEPHKGFETYLYRQQLLLDAANKVIGCAETLKMDGYLDGLQNIAEKISSQSFKVLIIGEFKTGKSTFINALIGEKVLPSFAWPCTAVITEIRYADAKRAVLYRREPAGASEEVDVADIENYIVIKDSSIEGVESPFERMDLYWPLTLCKNRIVLIDSPGLNEARVRSDVTMGYLPTADAILFVGSCEKPLSASEMMSLTSMRDLGFSQIFVIMNRFDLTDDSEKTGLKQHVYGRLDSITDIGKRGIHFVSSKQALEARRTNTSALYDASGFAALENELQHFLVHDRGKIKILQPSNQLQQLIPKILQDMEETKSLLQEQSDTLRINYEKAREPLNQLRIQSENIRRRVALFRSDMREVVRGRTRDFYVQVEGEIQTWLKNYTIKEPFNVASRDFFSPKASGERVVKEIGQFLETKLAEEAATWQRNTLSPVLNSRFDDFRTELDAMAQRFVHDVDAVKLQLAGKVAAPSVIGRAVGDVPPLERLLAAAGGLYLGGPLSAGAGYAFGFKTMFANVGIQMAVIVAAAIVGITNPILLLIAAWGASFGSTVLRGSKTNEEIKQAVGQAFAKEIRDNLAQLSDQASEKSFEATAELEFNLESGLTSEIQSAQHPVEFARKQQSEGTAAVASALRDLDSMRPVLQNAQSQLISLVAEIASEGPSLK